MARIAIIGAAALVATFAVVAPATAAGTGSISGTVRDAVTGHPDAGVTVILVGPTSTFFGTGPGQLGQTHTATDGSYSFTGLDPADSYQVCFSGDGAAAADEGQCYDRISWFPQLSDSSPGGGYFVPGQNISVSAGQHVTGIDGAMVLAATLSGHVTSAATGEPVVAQVTVGNTHFFGGTTSAADGSYTIKVPVDATGYQVCASPSNAYLQKCTTTGPVGTGQQVTGVNMAVDANTTAISGAVKYADTGQPASGVTVTLFFMDGSTDEFGHPIGQVEATTTTSPNGSYTFAQLPTLSNRYDVCFTPGSRYLTQCYQNTFWNSVPPSNGQYVMPAGATLVSPAIGQHITGIDAWLLPKPISISGKAVQSPLGNALGNVTVDVLSPTGVVLATAKTDKKGTYLVTASLTPTFYVCFDASGATGGLAPHGYFSQCWRNTTWTGHGAAPAGSTAITPGAVVTISGINAALRARL